MRGGKPVARPVGSPLPCHSCPKSQGTNKPNPGAELSDKNWRAYSYYRQCRADHRGILPTDRLVVWNNAIIAGVEERVGKASEASMMTMLFGAKAAGGAPAGRGRGR